MAGFQKIYTSQNQYLEDVARSTGLFDDEYYGIAKETGKDAEYLQLIANMKDNVSSSFDRAFYDKLSGEERFNYLATEQYMDKSSDDYKKSQEYFNQRAKQIKNEEIYSGLNGFQKAAHSFVGFLGNAFVQVGGILEGLVDSALMSMNFLAQSTGIPLIAGKAKELDEKTKELIAKDTTGYNAVQAAMNDYINTYTFIDKNFVAQTVNDVAAGLVRMVPMFIPGAGQAGYVAYLASGAGNTAQGIIQENPDINYWQMFAYTAASTGLEALTEWASGKLFGDDLVSSIMKGEKYVPTGNIIKTLAKNSATEGLEEFVAELFGGILYNRMIDPSKDVRIADALYAALIGGLTGFLMTGGKVLSTKKLSLHEGKLVDPATLTSEQRKAAKKIKLGDRWSLTTLINQVRQNQNAPDNVTKLMAKYGTSLNDIKTTHNAEYQEALKQDVATKTQQAKTILDLANVFRTIGEEQFQRATKFLEESLDEAQTLVDNYINHTAKANETAAQTFKALYPNETFTPKAIPSNSEQQLAKSIREIVPNTAVVFGDFGSKEGLAKASINLGGNFIFIKNGLVEEMGYEKVLNDVIKYEIANDLIGQLPVNVVNNLVTFALGEELKYSKLSKEQKLTIAQMICFDQKFNQKTFFGDKETHQKLYGYINNEVEKIRKFGKKTKSMQFKFNNLLKVRDRFIKSVADAVANQEDLANVRKRYNMSEEEFTKKVKDATRVSILNNTIRLTDLDFAEESITRMYAMKELLANITEDGDFDWSRLYDSTYYKPEFVAMVTQNESDFNLALRLYIAANYNMDLNAIQVTTILDSIKNIMSEQDVRDAAETVLTKEFLDSTTDLSTIQTELANKLFYMVQLDTAKVNPQTDSIVVTDNQIKGTGKLKFILGEISSGENLLSQEQRGSFSTSTGDVFKRMAPDSAEYSTTKFNNVEVDVQNDATLDDHQKALLEDCKNKYGLDLHFYKGAINYDGIILDNANGFISDNNVYLRYDGTLTNEEINNVIAHEATHRRIDAEPEKYKGLRNVLRKAMEGNEYNKWYEIHERLYKEIYKNNEDLIEEEMIVNIVSGIIKPTYPAAYKDVVKPWIGGFKKTSTKLMKKKISTGVKFSIQNNQNTSIQQKINKAESPKQIADVITSIIEAAPLEVSETKGYGDEGARLYKKTSDEMRRKYASLWTKITQENYDKIRNELVKSDYEYADEALLIFDRFTRAYAGNSTKFDEATKKKIMDVGSRKQTIAAISQGLQSAELANDHSFGETAAAFEKDGYKVTVSNDTVKEYVPEMANKKEFIKELDKEISNIEEQIKTAETDSDVAALNNQLDKAVEKRIVMSEGTNEEIMDWVIKNEDILTKASKLQKEVFEQMVEKGELAQKEGKKAVTILVDEKTGLPKPFPKATQFIEKNVKRLKSFRMWAMLTSPVSWVRNWVGNAGMTALDGMTNSLEKFITSKQKVMSQQEFAKLEKQHQELSRKEKLTDTEKSKLAQLSNQIARNYDFKFVETKASKDLRKQIAEDYKEVIQQILNGEDVKYESSAEKAAAITRAERKITRASQNANLGQKLWAACQSMTDWGLNTGWFGDNAVVVNSLIKNFANMIESNKTYLIKSLTTEYGKDGRGMSAERKSLVEKALKTKDSMDIVNAMSKYDVTLFMDSCKQRTFEQYFKNSNWLSQWASNLSKKHPIAASLTSLVLPFPKVAANILSMAYKYSPLGFLSAARQWSVVKQMDAAGYEGVRDAFARAKAGRTTAQATVGSFMMLAGLILASLGFIDIDDDDYLGPSLKVGDWKVSLSNLAPSMTTFSVGSAMMWAWKNDQSATLKALDVLYDNTLLGNIENVFRYGDPSKYIENLSINYFSQYVPAMLKLFAKFTTNQEMIDKSGSYFAKLGKTFASGIPGVANLLPKKINPYTGETLTGTGTSNVFFNFIEALSPLDMRFDVKSATQKEAERLGTESSGLSGTFKVNDKEYFVDKVTYAKYRANYIQDNFEKILSGKQKVTVEDENGKRITTTYDKLNDKQKKNVINRLYTDATAMTKIKWWTDQGNEYVVTNRDQYNEYRKMFNNIIYKKTWSKSKFVES